MSVPKKNIAFFDFDGTITNADSLLHFIMWYFKWPELIVKSIKFIPYYFYFKVLKKKNSLAKRMLFQIFFKGEKEQEFKQNCSQFSTVIIPKLINNKALERIVWHKANNDEVVVVSASVEYYLIPYFKKLDVAVIATKLEVKNQLLTGNFQGNNCYGIEKLTRIEKEVDLSEFAEVYAYGDSQGDKEMLERANHSYYKSFSKG